MVAPGAGRYMPGVDWTTGNLAVFDLERDEMTPITGSRWSEGGDFPMGSVISPDGRHIAYLWLHFVGMGVSDNQLRVIGRDGANERVLRSEPHPFWIAPLAWTPDGTAIVAWQKADGGAAPLEIVLVSADDGNTRVLERYDSGSLGRLFVSPDGRHVVYDVMPTGSTDADIYALDLNGGEPRALVRGNGNDQVMGWDPDGSGIFFYSNRELTRAIWRLSVADGRASGEPELVRADVWDLIPMGFSGDQYFYRVVRESPQIRTATLDIEAGRVVNPPAPIREPSEGWSRNPAWSPDGRYLAFLDYPMGVPWGVSQARLGIRSVHTGETRYLPFPFASGSRPWWLPDARTLTVFGRYQGTRGVYRLDLQSGVVTKSLEREESSGEGGVAPSPDGNTYYFHRDRSGIYARDIGTGRETLLARVEGLWRRIGVSPDDETLVVRAGGCGEESRLLVLPTSGGEPREIYRGMRLGCSDFLEITPDGKYVIAATFGPSAVLRFSMDGGEPIQLLGEEAPRGFDMSPDGRRIAYWEWADPVGSNEIWVIEGLTRN
jgi:Tol biopolymer transport system component